MTNGKAFRSAENHGVRRTQMPALEGLHAFVVAPALVGFSSMVVAPASYARLQQFKPPLKLDNFRKCHQPRSGNRSARMPMPLTQMMRGAVILKMISMPYLVAQDMPVVAFESFSRILSRVTTRLLASFSTSLNGTG